jgi:hypothetical protein
VHLVGYGTIDVKLGEPSQAPLRQDRVDGEVTRHDVVKVLGG